jgi:hypothetical protein
VTAASNSATLVGGIFNSGRRESENTIIANNTVAGNGGVIVNGGNNLQFNPNTGCGGTIPSGDPKLACSPTMVVQPKQWRSRLAAL